MDRIFVYLGDTFERLLGGIGYASILETQTLMIQRDLEPTNCYVTAIGYCW